MINVDCTYYKTKPPKALRLRHFSNINTKGRRGGYTNPLYFIYLVGTKM